MIFVNDLLGDEIVTDIFECDFKDKLRYTEPIEIQSMSNLEKWLAYDLYAKTDADVVLRKDKAILEKLNWNNKWIDAIFPMRQVLYTLIKTICVSIDKKKLYGMREEWKSVLEENLLTTLKNKEISNPERWMKEFWVQIENYAKNVNTIGNYMPCPDEEYNKINGWIGKWHYNDRIELLYIDLLNPIKTNTKGKRLISDKKCEEWTRWFKENETNACLDIILRKCDELNEFGCLKKTVFDKGQLERFPNYLSIANNLIESRSKMLKEKMVEVNFYEKVEDSLLKFAVIIAKSDGKWVFCKHRERDTYEVPGGHREDGEEILETAKRELKEETGAVVFDIKPICVYSVKGKTRVNEQLDDESFGMLYYANIASFEELHSEIETILITDKLVDNWTYPLIQPRLIEEAQKRGFI